ncbi:MAG: SDR family oxidoreductase [Gammaproteobacteria bacterium]|nr:SDR family oxidoreductase [Gammaproteobacteria bacterium]
MRGLDGRCAIVTGGARGIGRAIAERLALEKCSVGLFDIDSDLGAQTAEEIGTSTGGRVRFFATDITDYEAVRASVTEFESVLGPTEILVNNAGWDRMLNFLDSGPELWRRVIDINLYGPIHLHHAVLKGMAEREFGRVINIASDAGRVGSSGEAVYSACKGGIIAFSKTVARELARRGVTVNTVCPGPTDTPLLQSMAVDGGLGERIVPALERAVPMRRIGQPQDYPGIVAFLASDDAGFITGQTISVSGGLTMV